MQNLKVKDNYFMRRKACSAVRTLKGRFFCRVKKCLFSVTRISVFTQSAYAPMNASAGFKPRARYFSPNSNGTNISSSIVVRLFKNTINFLKSSRDTFLLTSSTIRRVIRSLFELVLPRRTWMSRSQFGSFMRPNAKIYSFASRTKTNFLSPKFFSRFTKLRNHFFFQCFCQKGSLAPVVFDFVNMLFSFLRAFFIVAFHQVFSPFITTIAYPDDYIKGNFAYYVKALKV